MKSLRAMLKHIKANKQLMDKKKKGLTYDELSEELNIPRSTLSDAIELESDLSYKRGKRVEAYFNKLIGEGND